MKELIITGVYRDKGKIVYYDVGDWKDVIALKPCEIIEKLNKGYTLKNGYRRGDSIVLSSKRNVFEKKYKGVVNVVFSPDSGYNNLVPNLFDTYVEVGMFDDVAFEIVRRIDRATPVKNFEKYGRFESPFDLCRMDELSDGCKSALYGYMCGKQGLRYKINIASMGVNAIVVLMDVLIKLKMYNITLVFHGCPTELKDEFDGYLFRDVDGVIRQFDMFVFKYVHN